MAHPDLVLVRTPMRLSFLGGGSDLPLYTDSGSSGCVLSAAIDCYSYVLVKRRHDQHLVVHYNDIERVTDIAELDNSYVREALRSLGFRRGLEIVSMGDLSYDFCGLGGSSSFLISLLSCLHRLKGEDLNPSSLAEEAFQLETDVLGKKIGRQDHYAVAFGGCARLIFIPEGTVLRHPIYIPEGIEDKLLLLYVGRRKCREEEIFDEIHQPENRERSIKLYSVLADLAHKGNLYALRGYWHKAFELMNDSWIAKRGTAAAISNDKIENLMADCFDAGAKSGKLCGAGGGGCLLLWCPEGKKEVVDRLRKKIKRVQEVDFHFVKNGVQVILEL